MRKIWIVEVFCFLGKHFLYSPYGYLNEWVGDVIPSQLFTRLLTEITKNVYSHILQDRAMLLPVSSKNEKFQNCMYNNTCIYDKLWGHGITNSLIWIFIRTGQEIFS